MIVEYLIYFICFFICLINFNWIYARLNKKCFNITFKDVLVILVFSTISTMIAYLNFGYLKMFFSIISGVIYNYYKFKDKFRKIVLYSLIIWLSGIFLDIVVMNFLVSILNSGVVGKFFIKYVATFVMQIIHNVIFIFEFIKMIFNKMYNVFNKVGLELLLIIILSLVFFDMNIFMNLDNIRHINIYFVMFIFCIYFYVKNKYLEKYYKNTILILENNNKFYVQDENETRTFKHNLLSKLQGIKSLGNSKVNIMVDEIVSECLNVNLHNNEFDKIPIGVNGFIEQKLFGLNRQEYEILINNQIEESLIDIIGPKKYVKFCNSLGVILDNAVEAIKNANEKILYIDFEEDEKFINVEVRNTFTNIIDIDKFGKINYSTKIGKRGIGLFSIFDNAIVNVNFKIFNNFFISKIVVHK